MHQDHAGVGVAMPDRLFTWRLERLKEVGCNAIRMSHNPVAPFLLDECDRLGFLVIAENRHLGDTYEDQTPKETPAVEHRDLSALVTRDRNHPSIILWSLCNEQWIQGSPEAAAMARVMRQRVLELDPSRPVTAALNGGFDTPEGLLGVLDVIGINYNPRCTTPYTALRPRTPIIASEIASEIGTRGVYTTNHWEDYYGDRERGYVSAYSITAGPAGQTVEKAWPLSRPGILSLAALCGQVSITKANRALRMARHKLPLRFHGHLRVSERQLLLLQGVVDQRTGAAPLPALELAGRRGRGDLRLGP